MLLATQLQRGENAHVVLMSLRAGVHEERVRYPIRRCKTKLALTTFSLRVYFGVCTFTIGLLHGKASLRPALRPFEVNSEWSPEVDGARTARGPRPRRCYKTANSLCTMPAPIKIIGLHSFLPDFVLMLRACKCDVRTGSISPNAYRAAGNLTRPAATMCNVQLLRGPASRHLAASCSHCPAEPTSTNLQPPFIDIFPPCGITGHHRAIATHCNN